WRLHDGHFQSAERIIAPDEQWHLKAVYVVHLQIPQRFICAKLALVDIHVVEELDGTRVFSLKYMTVLPLAEFVDEADAVNGLINLRRICHERTSPQNDAQSCRTLIGRADVASFDERQYPRASVQRQVNQS